MNPRRMLAASMYTFGRLRRRVKMFALRPLFAQTGRNVIFDPDGTYTFSTIEFGDDVYVGPGARFSADGVRIRIGNWVIMGPGVTIMAGDHNASVVGTPMRFVKEKRAEDDRDVCIEEDVWIGANVTILKGVTVGRGSIVGAGAVVTRSLPRYSIAVGVPARVVRPRWSWAMIQSHEGRIYPPDQHTTVEELQAAFPGIAGTRPLEETTRREE